MKKAGPHKQPRQRAKVCGCPAWPAWPTGARGSSGQNRAAESEDRSEDRGRKKYYQWSDGVALEFLEYFIVALIPGPHDHASGLGVCPRIIS
jgi:hypothetical protein